MQDSQKQSIREKFEEFILPETYDTYQGMTFEQVEKITTFWLTLIEEELSRQREEMVGKVEGMKEEEQFIHCTCSAFGRCQKQCSKSRNQALDDLLSLLSTNKEVK